MSVSIDAFTVLPNVPNVVKGPSAATWQYILVASCSNWWKQEIFLHTIWEFNVFFVCFFVGPVFHLFEWIDISYKKTGVRCEWTSLELFQSISRMSAHTSGTNISSVASSRKWYDSLMSNSQHAGHIGQLPVHQPTLSALANEDTLNLNPHVVYHNSRRHSVDAGTNHWSPIEDGNIMKYPTFWLFCTDWGKGLWRMSSFLLPVPYLPCHGHSLLLLYFMFCPPAIASEYETQMQEIFDAELHSMREKLGFWHFVCMDWYGMTCWPEKVLGRGEMYFRT